SHVHIFADNTSAISTIYDSTAHPAQAASIIFRKNVDLLLTESAALRISVQWAPAHKGIKGNERSDKLAKEA
ncbi:hypothetical protein BV25DRAFT_1766088, partial [Artomyces pyxidatus]